jgi:Icc-related predicted phosphoesterase
MKILHTTDLHFNKHWFKWIENQQNNFDIFCISGDFLDSSSDESKNKQIDWITKWIKRFEQPLFVCSGNHDLDESGDERWIKSINTSNYYPDESIKEINSIKFGCYPYLGAQGYYEFAECDVLLTHIPPAFTKTSIDENENEWGDKELYRAIINHVISPKIILCGHLHAPSLTKDKLKDTVVYNPGCGKINTLNHHMITL